MANKSLRSAKEAKNDEFYTLLSDIERELRNYSMQLRGKTIFCNCDDPFESNFFKYFAMNFNQLGLKKLIATCYNPSSVAGSQLALFDVKPPLKKGLSKNSKQAYKIEISEVRDYNGDGSINLGDVEYLLKHDGNSLKLLTGNGDFRGKESISLLEKADVVVTNPPFSLFTEFLDQLIHYKKNFIIVAPDTALHYKNIFKLIKEDKLWLGYGKVKEFIQPDGTIKKMGNISWFTNLDTTKRHELLTLYKKYTPDEYPHYDNFDAIDVGKTSEIPEDFFGKMGVPDAFLDKYNPEQFELIGIPTGNSGKEIGVTKNYRGRTDISFTKNGKTSCPYSRIIIQRKTK
ncbi:MAG TPA: adenine-specific methyltransferase EcoRI family protein [Saprospiraceae bacterium]|nr:adenine-specific methyltransferase EcoRI family protein [Saprospiraceae bacterium]